MSSFWPKGIELSDTQSPKDVLETAREDWQESSDGAMELVLQDAKSESGNSMIIVHAKHVASNRTATLFSVVHRRESPYPARIQPKEEDLPSFLKKTRSNPIGLPEIVFTGTTISDQWVSDTPSEFRKALTAAFNLGVIKREILNLASNATNNNTNEDLIEDFPEDSED
jgi:hypothetical protein